MSLEAAIRSMLTAGSTINLVPDARITHGYRLQDSALPAIVFEVGGVETASPGATDPARIRRAEVTVTCVATEAVDALAIAAQVRAASVPGTFSSYQFTAVIYGNHVAQQGSAGEGDESEPATAVCTMTIYYTEA